MAARAPQTPSVAFAAGGERDGQQRERGRRQQRGADALYGADRDEHAGGGREPAGQRGGREQAEAGEEHAAAAEQVARPAAEEQEAAEGERVGVHHPLEAVGGEPEISLDGGERDVHDRDVEDHHELREGEDGEDEPPRVGGRGRIIHVLNGHAAEGTRLT